MSARGSDGCRGCGRDLPRVASATGLRSLPVAHRRRQRQSASSGPERPPRWRFGMCVPGCQEAVRHALSRRGFFKGALAASFGATAVAPETAGAAPARSFTSVVDLTHTMSPDFPTFFGVPGIEMDKKFDLKKDGFNLYWWRIIEHAGTHLDAPIHFSETGATAEKISADTLVVPLAVVDVAAKAARNPDYLLTTEDLADWEKRHDRLPDNCCVAMQSGWAQ